MSRDSELKPTTQYLELNVWNSNFLGGMSSEFAGGVFLPIERIKPEGSTGSMSDHPHDFRPRFLEV
jgi:hypothetical protein